MEPVFTLPYSEFCVAQQLAKLLPADSGYSLYAPVSRQQPGVDLVLAHRRGLKVRVACIQVKSSRVYFHPKMPFQYLTWFKNFECPPQADFFCLVALYPAVDSAQRRKLGAWWVPQILLFSQPEMRQFLRSVRTVSGKRDPMFGFGFNDSDKVIQTRGDSARRYRDFSHRLLSRRVADIRNFLRRSP